MSNYKEEFPFQAERLSGHPDSVRKEKDVMSETQDLPMHIHDPKTQALDGVPAHQHKSHFSRAVDHLNRQVQRGEHAPMVGGYKHDHTMR
jgi:hypothetical protein